LPVEEPGSLLIATVAFSALVATVVLIHHEVLVRLSSVLGKMGNHHHFRLIVAVPGGSGRSCSGSINFCHSALCYAPYPGLGAADW